MKIDGGKFIYTLPGTPEWTLTSIRGVVLATASGYRPRIINGIEEVEEVDPPKSNGQDQQSV